MKKREYAFVRLALLTMLDRGCLLDDILVLDKSSEFQIIINQNTDNLEIFNAVHVARSRLRDFNHLIVKPVHINFKNQYEEEFNELHKSGKVISFENI